MDFTSLPRHFPTFVEGYRGLRHLIRSISRAGVWLAPRLAMAIVLVMTFVMAWVLALPESNSRFMVPAVRGRTTLVGFLYRTPPPWPRGNCFGVTKKARWLGPARGTGASEWNVVNMHAENFSAIAARLRLRTVEIQPIGGVSCLITDPRVPREWLLEEPCRSCNLGPAREQIRKRYPQYFRAQYAR